MTRDDDDDDYDETSEAMEEGNGVQEQKVQEQKEGEEDIDQLYQLDKYESDEESPGG